jgi:hypothetical protein
MRVPHCRDTLIVTGISAGLCTVSLLFIIGHPLFRYPVVDAAWHHEWASRVASGDFLAYAPFFRAPLYPWLLGLAYLLLGPGPFTGAILSILLTCSGAAVFHRLALRMMPPPWALASGLAWAMWGTSVFYSTQLLIEPLFITLLLASLLLLTGKRHGWAGWLALGLAAAARPSALLLVPAAWYAAGRPRLPRMLPVLAPVIAVWLCNALAGDPMTLISSQGGVNLYIGNSLRSDGRTAFAPLEVAGIESPEGGGYVDNVHLASLAAFPDVPDGSGISSRWTGRTVSEVLSDPGGWLLLMGLKVVYFASPVEIPSNYDPYYYRSFSPLLRVLLQPPPAALPWLLLWVLLPGALLSGAGGGRASAGAGRFGLILAAGTILFFVTARFRLPAAPFLLLWLAARISRAPRRALLLAPAGAAAGLVLGFLTAGTVRSSGVNMPFHDGCAHYSAGLYEEAETLFMMALDRSMARDDIDLNGADAMYNLGLLAARRDDMLQAAHWWSSALERRPGFLPARRALDALGSLDPGGPLE